MHPDLGDLDELGRKSRDAVSDLRSLDAHGNSGLGIELLAWTNRDGEVSKAIKAGCR